ncbi:MAG: Helix-turn-helix domain [Nitrospira sp.]|jgi:excisionase family DNA binding protein|nr:Helix-turn-helix domain [Nitrospira sp.]
MPDTDVLQEIRDLLRGYKPVGFVGMPALCQYLDTPPNTVREWIRTKGFPFYKPGKALQFKLTEVDQWMQKFKPRAVNLTGGK